jgi:hypothetical protein
MVQAGERQGPCANPGCKKPEGTRLAQWTRIPESFQGWDDLADGHNGCVCRGVDCRDFVGLPPLSGQRKRPALAEGTAVQPAVPRPQFVLSPVALCACGPVPRVRRLSNRVGDMVFGARTGTYLPHNSHGVHVD